MKTRRGTWSNVGAILAACSLGACSSAGDGAANDGGADAHLPRQGSDRIPCEQRATLEGVCQKCHGRPPTSGAPFSLVDRSDIVDSRQMGTLVRELMIAQLESRHMPLAPETIDEESRSQLLAWLYVGAPAVESQACSVRDGGDEATDDRAESE